MRPLCKNWKSFILRNVLGGGMNLFMDKTELESLTGLKTNRLYLVCPNEMILVFDLDEIFFGFEIFKIF